MDSCIGNGIECNVYDVGDDIVYKEYVRNKWHSQSRQKQLARTAFELQCIAAKTGLAPAVIAYTGIGYYSEKVKIYKNFTDSERIKFPEQKSELMDKITEVFEGPLFDDHKGNFGLKDDGTLCVIDFGMAGFSGTPVGLSIEEKCEVVG